MEKYIPNITGDEIIKTYEPLVKQSMFILMGGSWLPSLNCIDERDLLQDGRLALLKNYPRYDPLRGEFKVFIISRIKFAMIGLLRKCDFVLREVRRNANNIIKLINQTEIVAGRELANFEKRELIKVSLNIENPEEILSVAEGETFLPFEFINSGMTDFNSCDIFGLKESLDIHPRIDLQQAIPKLCPRSVKAIVMFYYWNRPQLEISKALNIKEGSVGTILFKARQNLKQIINQ